MKMPCVMICLAAAGWGCQAQAQSNVPAQRPQPLEAWFDTLKSSQALDARVDLAQAPEVPRKAVEAWFNRVLPAPVPPVTAGRDVSGKLSGAGAPLALKLEQNFESLKYLIFFASGSAQIGPNGRKTIGLLLPKAREASRISISTRSDPTGDPRANEVLTRRRAEAVAAALRQGGATRPSYEVAIDNTEEMPSDAQAVWKPSNDLGSLRRALINVQSSQSVEP